LIKVDGVDRWHLLRSHRRDCGATLVSAMYVGSHWVSNKLCRSVGEPAMPIYWYLYTPGQQA